MTGLRKAVFLDRDGVVNVDKGYIYRREDFQFLPRVPEAIGLLNKAGYLVIVVTNQSGIARGFYTLDDVTRLHDHVDAELAHHGSRIDAYYLCPHHPDHGPDGRGGECLCRKPLPGMLLEAAADLSVDLSRSFMVGDKLSDVEAGLAAGCSPILVGGDEDGTAQDARRRGAAVCSDLMGAVELIVGSGS
ncbi:MAG: D-glycero-beta-D-manno-heptose 1,7-bisphosphate 7-phosphatase [Geobacteraceae bacterium]|nr:D-glycero-beta-D-manno-heptose 1,7-bisphosphate 7-phosphatase [Geobacteraceae bacterium]